MRNQAEFFPDGDEKTWFLPQHLEVKAEVIQQFNPQGHHPFLCLLEFWVLIQERLKSLNRIFFHLVRPKYWSTNQDNQTDT